MTPRDKAQRPWTLKLPGEVALDTVRTSHGWIALAPFREEPDGGLSTACDLEGEVVEILLRPASGGVKVRVSHAPRSASARGRVPEVARRMLQMDRNLQAFWQRCEGHPALCWVARRRAGRMLCAPTLFEDLAKILLTTNCAWSSTVRMVERLVESLGPAAASGRRAFPDAARCAAQTARFYQDEIRTGYRAGALIHLAQAFAEQRLPVQRWSDPEFPDDALREELLQLPGFGPYAAGQAMRLLGRGRELALDSWCRARWAELHGRRTAAADRTIERTVRPFRPDQGLALWLWLTGAWYGEPTRPWKSRA